MTRRSAGVLLHPTSLAGPHGIGDLGPAARDYVAWLGQAGVGWWQVLPLHPPGPGDSPYSSTSTFAGNPWLISPDDLVADGLLNASDLAAGPTFSSAQVDYGAATAWKAQLLERAYGRYRERPGELGDELEAFAARHRWWLEDYTLFAAVKADLGGSPTEQWPEGLALRQPEALEAARARLADAQRFHTFCQLVFFRQLERLREAAQAAGVRILGDVPIFVARDSADVWANPGLFRLDERNRPTVVAGVPPDYFSATGQLWGNPMYNWERHAADGYRWWIRRFGHGLEMADAVRLDHFRGFEAAWEVPATDEVATRGRWVEGPGRALFEAVRSELGSLPLVAEDLGDITPAVIALRKGLGLPGMAILQFGFAPRPRSSFIPYAHEPDLVVYTGTHDNNTTVGWYQDEASDDERHLFRRYAASDGREPHWDMIRLAMASVAQTAIVPHQDLLGLGSEARMNRPGVGQGNWRFRLSADGLDDVVAERVLALVDTYGRLPETLTTDHASAQLEDG